jgi:hypothetical protein
MKIPLLLIACIALFGCSTGHRSRIGFDEHIRLKTAVVSFERTKGTFWTEDEERHLSSFQSLVLKTKILSPMVLRDNDMLLEISNFPESDDLIAGQVVYLTVSGKMLEDVSRLGFSYCRYADLNWIIEKQKIKTEPNKAVEPTTIHVTSAVGFFISSEKLVGIGLYILRSCQPLRALLNLESAIVATHLAQPAGHLLIASSARRTF